MLENLTNRFKFPDVNKILDGELYTRAREQGTAPRGRACKYEYVPTVNLTD